MRTKSDKEIKRINSKVYELIVNNVSEFYTDFDKFIIRAMKFRKTAKIIIYTVQ